MPLDASWHDPGYEVTRSVWGAVMESAAASVNAPSSRGDALGNRLKELHRHLLERFPRIDRIACALYDAGDDLLKTFVDSTRSGEPICGHEFCLSESESLRTMASTGEPRVLDAIQEVVKPVNRHSRWLLDQGYQSSFTVPLFDGREFIGVLFYDSCSPAALTPRVQKDLSVFSMLMSMTISRDMSLVRSMASSAHVAREFAALRDFETGGHLERMAHYARLIAKHLQRDCALTDEYIEHLYLFAPLHDIGKIGIPDRILLKPGPLTPAERVVMETHVNKGVVVLQRMLGDFQLDQLPDADVMLNVVAAHHECLDGSGYPNRLSGDAVPLEARIIAVADVFDALTSQRPYKDPWTWDEAMAELRRLVATGKLDHRCVDAIEAHADEMIAIRDRFNDTLAPAPLPDPHGDHNNQALASQ